MSAPLLNLGQVAARLGISRTTAWRLVRSGEIPSVPITETLRRVDPGDLEAWIAGRREQGRAPAGVEGIGDRGALRSVPDGVASA